MPTKIEGVAIIGGGIIGLSTAIALLRRGVAVTLVSESGLRGTASWGNAGHIAVEQVEPLASMAMVRSMPHRLFWRGGPLSLPLRRIGTWLPFSLRLLAAAAPARFAHGQAALRNALHEAMPAWRRLAEATGCTDLLIEQGHYIVWEKDASAREGRAAWEGKDIGTATLRDILPTEMAIIQAQIAQLDHPLCGGVRFQGSGHITDPDLLADRLEGQVAMLGGERIAARVRGLQKDGETVRLLLGNSETLTADIVIMAAGVASGPLMESVGHKVPMIAERGYHIEAPADWPSDLPPVVFEDRSMIVTRFRDRLRVASIVEFSTADAPPDPRKWERLEGHAAALRLPFTAKPTRWMGSRPTLPDYLPAIGRSTAAANLFYAFGHQHLGLTLGPITGEAIAALIAEEKPPIDLAPFALERLGG
jgi:D-amino-acid dehydrogenase